MLPLIKISVDITLSTILQ